MRPFTWTWLLLYILDCSWSDLSFRLKAINALKHRLHIFFLQSELISYLLPCHPLLKPGSSFYYDSISLILRSTSSVARTTRRLSSLCSKSLSASSFVTALSRLMPLIRRQSCARLTSWTTSRWKSRWQRKVKRQTVGKRTCACGSQRAAHTYQTPLWPWHDEHFNVLLQRKNLKI